MSAWQHVCLVRPGARLGALVSMVRRGMCVAHELVLAETCSTVCPLHVPLQRSMAGGAYYVVLLACMVGVLHCNMAGAWAGYDNVTHGRGDDDGKLVECACVPMVHVSPPPTPFCFRGGSHTPTRGRNRGGCVWVCGIPHIQFL